MDPFFAQGCPTKIMRARVHVKLFDVATTFRVDSRHRTHSLEPPRPRAWKALISQFRHEIFWQPPILPPNPLPPKSLDQPLRRRGVLKDRGHGVGRGGASLGRSVGSAHCEHLVEVHVDILSDLAQQRWRNIPAAMHRNRGHSTVWMTELLV